MDYCCGHHVALYCLQAVDSLADLTRSSARLCGNSIPDVLRLMHLLEGECARSGSAAEVRSRLGELVKRGIPLDLLVADASSRSSSKRVRCRVWNPPVREAYCFDLGDGLALSAPEACYVQMACVVDDLTLMKIGFELCGSYALDEGLRVGFRNRAPLTNTGALRAFVDKMGSANGVKRARRCLRYVRDNSASPMETCLALLFGLPAARGGYGLGVPELNVGVSVPAASRAKVGFGRYHCDLFWRDHRIALEYNSREFHLEEQAVARDSARMNDLALFDVTAFTATRLQIADVGETDRLARLIAGSMGKRVDREPVDVSRRRQALRRALFSKDTLF